MRRSTGVAGKFCPYCGQPLAADGWCYCPDMVQARREFDRIGWSGVLLLGSIVAGAIAAFILVGRARGGEADTLPRRPCDAQAAAMQPAVPKTTGVPELDDLLREAKRRNATVAQQFNEDGVGLVWFQATPDGWLSRTAPPVVKAPPVVPQPRPEVAVAPPARTFRGNQPVWHEGHRCPACNFESPDGEGTWVIRGGNPGGVHAHECPRCHTRWIHSR